MSESDWLTNILRYPIIFRKTLLQAGTTLHVHFNSQNDCSYFKGPYIIFFKYYN